MHLWINYLRGTGISLNFVYTLSLWEVNLGFCLSLWLKIWSFVESLVLDKYLYHTYLLTETGPKTIWLKLIQCWRKSYKVERHYNPNWHGERGPGLNKLTLLTWLFKSNTYWKTEIFGFQAMVVFCFTWLVSPFAWIYRKIRSGLVESPRNIIWKEAEAGQQIQIVVIIHGHAMLVHTIEEVVIR